MQHTLKKHTRAPAHLLFRSNKACARACLKGEMPWSTQDTGWHPYMCQRYQIIAVSYLKAPVVTW